MLKGASLSRNYIDKVSRLAILNIFAADVTIPKGTMTEFLELQSECFPAHNMDFVAISDNGTVVRGLINVNGKVSIQCAEAALVSKNVSFSVVYRTI